MKGFKNINAYVENKGIIVTDIAFDNGVITAIRNDLDITEEITVPNGAIILPGFVDRHIHGANTSDTMDGNLEAITNLSLSIVDEPS